MVRQADVQAEAGLAEAKKLLAEAGYGPSKPLTTKILISTSGSGQMQPLPMNEFVQQNLAEVGIKVEFEVVEWNTLINIWRAGAKHESSRGATGMNYTYFIQDPFTGFMRHLQCNLVPPGGTNWGYYCDPEMDGLFDAVAPPSTRPSRPRCCRRSTRNMSTRRCSSW